MDDLIASVKNFNNSSEVLNHVQNGTTMLRSLDERGLLETTSPATLRLYSDLARNFPILAEDVKIRKPFEDLLRATADGGIKSPSMSKLYESTLTPGKSNLSSVFGPDGIMQSTIPSVNDSPEVARKKDPKEFQERFDSVFQYLNNETNIAKRNAAIGDYVKEMGRPEMRERYENMPVQTQDQFLELLDIQAQLVANSVDDVLKKANDQGIQLQTRIVEGRMRFTSDDTSPTTQQFLRRENLRVATAHTDLVQAFSVRFNKPFNETSKMLQKVFVPQDRQRLMDVLDELEVGIQANQQEVGDPKLSGVTSLIKDEEGFRQNAYLDVAGVPTVGYGFTKIDGEPVKIGDTITKEQADQELQKQIQSHSAFRGKVETDLTPQQEQALASFEFNLGSGIWNTTGRPIIEAINGGDFETAAAIIKRHDKARDPNSGELRQVSGLTTRREREAALLTADNGL
jgi:lysozyme